MVEFSLWDILRNLLLALRWTVVLSLIAFVGGGVVGGLLLFLRLSGGRVAERADRRSTCSCSRARRC